MSQNTLDLAKMLLSTLLKERKTVSGYVSGYLQECVCGYLGGLLNFFDQDPAMPSQEPPADAKDEEVDLPPDDTEDADGSKLSAQSCVLLTYCHKLINGHRLCAVIKKQDDSAAQDYLTAE